MRLQAACHPERVSTFSSLFLLFAGQFPHIAKDPSGAKDATIENEKLSMRCVPNGSETFPRRRTHARRKKSPSATIPRPSRVLIHSFAATAEDQHLVCDWI